MKGGVLVVLAAFWAAGCRGKEGRAADDGDRRGVRGAGLARSHDSEPSMLWRSREEFLGLLEVRDHDLRPKIVEALRAEFVAFAAGFEDEDVAVVEFAKARIEGAEEGPERDRVLDHLLEAFPDSAYRGKLQVVLDYYSYPGSKSDAIGSILASAFETDPAWAFATAGSLEEPRYREEAYSDVTVALCEKCGSFQEAFAMARGYTGDDMPGAVLEAIGDFADRDNWEEAKPENPGEILAEILGSITVPSEARDEFVSDIMRASTDRDLARTVTVFRDLDVRSRQAWGTAARDAPEITLENARYFLDAVPEEASVESVYLVDRLEELVGVERVFELVAGLDAEGQRLAIPHAIYEYAKAVGVSEALRNVRERLAPPAYRRAVETLDGYSGHLEDADRALVEATWEGLKSQEPPRDDE